MPPKKLSFEAILETVHNRLSWPAGTRKTMKNAAFLSLEFLLGKGVTQGFDHEDLWHIVHVSGLEAELPRKPYGERKTPEDSLRAQLPADPRFRHKTPVDSNGKKTGARLWTIKKPNTNRSASIVDEQALCRDLSSGGCLESAARAAFFPKSKARITSEWIGNGTQKTDGVLSCGDEMKNLSIKGFGSGHANQVARGWIDDSMPHTPFRSAISVFLGLGSRDNPDVEPLPKGGRVFRAARDAVESIPGETRIKETVPFLKTSLAGPKGDPWGVEHVVMRFSLPDGTRQTWLSTVDDLVSLVEEVEPAETTIGCFSTVEGRRVALFSIKRKGARGTDRGHSNYQVVANHKPLLRALSSGSARATRME